MKRSLVAVVRAQPETAVESAHRALRLARAQDPRAWSGPTRIVLQDEFGASTTPWQLHAALEWARAQRIAPESALACGSSARSMEMAGDPALRRVLQHHGLPVASLSSSTVPVEVGELRRLRALRTRRPSVAAELPGSTLLLLTTPFRTSRGVLRGAVAHLCSLVGSADELSSPDPELRSDLLGLALGATAGRWFLVDVSRCGSDATWGRPSLENLWVAGDDPLACDAVVARLVLGIEPERIEWMRHCAERGLGAIGRREVLLKGDLEESGPDREAFAGRLPGADVGSRAGGLGRVLHSVDPRRVLRPWKMRRWQNAYARTPWGRLHVAYRDGVEPRSEDRP